MEQKELIKRYPSAYNEVMNTPLRRLWDGMELDRQEEVLKGIAYNQQK